MHIPSFAARFGVTLPLAQPGSNALIQVQPQPGVLFGGREEGFESTQVVTAPSADPEELRQAAYQAVVQSAISGRESKLAFDGVEVTVKPYKMSPDEVVEAFNRDYQSVLRNRKEASGERLIEQLALVRQHFNLDEATRTQMESVMGPLCAAVQHVAQLPNGELLVLARAKEETRIQVDRYNTLYYHVFQGQPGQLRQLALKDVGQWGNVGYTGVTQDGGKFYFPGWGMQDKPEKPTYQGQDKAFNWANQLSQILDMPELTENIGLVRQIIVDGQPTANYRDFSRKQPA